MLGQNAGQHGTEATQLSAWVIGGRRSCHVEPESSESGGSLRHFLIGSCHLLSMCVSVDPCALIELVT